MLPQVSMEVAEVWYTVLSEIFREGLGASLVV